MLNFFAVMFFMKEYALVILSFFLAWGLGQPHAFLESRPVGAMSQAEVTPTSTPTLAEHEISISSPGGGESLQGVVNVAGAVRSARLVSYEVAFAYQSNPTQTWFLIGQGSSPVEQEALARWDTTTISDGVYRLRVQMFLSDGQVMESFVEGLRVRNYSLVETSTPAPTGQIATIEALPAARATVTPSSTPLPEFVASERTAAPQATNAAAVSADRLAFSAGMGMALVAAAMGLGVLYFGLKALLRH